MTNEILFFISILFYLGTVLVAYRFFGKTGLFVWSAVGVILANIEVIKMVTMFGMSVTLGNALYASTFVVTDILSENYTKADAKKAVNIGLFVTITWVIATQLILVFRPNELDFIQPAFEQMFGLMPRMALAGIFTYAVVQRLDVYLYHKWWHFTDKRFGTGAKYIWIRNNGSTLISQFADTIIFTVVAFAGILPTGEMIGLIIPSYILKAMVGVLDTPIIYLAKKWQQDGKIPDETHDLPEQRQKLATELEIA